MEIAEKEDTYEFQLSDFFREFAEQNGLEITTGPPNKSFTLRQKARDEKGTATLYLTLFKPNVRQDMRLVFDEPISPDRIISICERLRIGNIMINGHHYNRNGQSYECDIFDKLTGNYEKKPLNGDSISYIGFDSEESIDEIKRFGKFISDFLKL